VVTDGDAEGGEAPGAGTVMVWKPGGAGGGETMPAGSNPGGDAGPAEGLTPEALNLASKLLISASRCSTVRANAVCDVRRATSWSCSSSDVATIGPFRPLSGDVGPADVMDFVPRRICLACVPTDPIVANR
jgi:hypothetical protein